MRKLGITLILMACCLAMQAEETYLFATKDTARLYLDIHRPSAEADTLFNEVRKPTILYVFGGGFVKGARNQAYMQPWYQMLNDAGYTVVAIDYRLGMKGYKIGKGLIGAAKALGRFQSSQQMGVEDVFSAVKYLNEHPELGIDIHNIVLAGSSAGAIISLACVHAISNGMTYGLPADFEFRGAMCFAGGIIGNNGTPKFPKAPCPLLLLHGIKDNAVAYTHLGDHRRGIWGSNSIAKTLKKQHANYCIYRFEERNHDVASYMNYVWSIEQAFLERNVMQHIHRTVDATINDPSLPIFRDWGAISVEEIYSGE